MGYSYFIPSSSSSSVIPILIITFSLLIPTAFPFEDYYDSPLPPPPPPTIVDSELGHICLNNTKPFTIAYNQSRALVVMNLIINTANEGFKTASYSWPLQNPDEWTHGLALCRGDVSHDDCKTCVNTAALTLIYTLCPDSRAAIIYRDYCHVKYSDVDFIGKIDDDDDTRLTMWNRETFGNNYLAAAATTGLLSDLTQTAIGNPDKFFANGSTAVDDEGTEVTLYGIAQCTRDISTDDCQACLGHAVSNISNCCAGKEGGRVLFGSCNMRFEIYNFLSN